VVPGSGSVDRARIDLSGDHIARFAKRNEI